MFDKTKEAFLRLWTHPEAQKARETLQRILAPAEAKEAFLKILTLPDNTPPDTSVITPPQKIAKTNQNRLIISFDNSKNRSEI